jgi:hypothetical protein
VNTLLHAIVYGFICISFLNKLLNVLVQIAHKMGLKKVCWEQEGYQAA